MWNAELQAPYRFPLGWFIFLGSGPHWLGNPTRKREGLCCSVSFLANMSVCQVFGASQPRANCRTLSQHQQREHGRCSGCRIGI